MAPLLEVHCYFSWLGHSQMGTSNEWVGHVIAFFYPPSPMSISLVGCFEVFSLKNYCYSLTSLTFFTERNCSVNATIPSIPVCAVFLRCYSFNCVICAFSYRFSTIIRYVWLISIK